MKKTHAVVHCASTKPSMDIGAQEIRRWHLARGWSDIGYAYVIRRDGTVEEGRDLDGDGDVLDETGAHVLGHNRESVGVCLAGGLSEDGKRNEANFTPEQYRALRGLLDSIVDRLGPIAIWGHTDYAGVAKACPCFDVMHWLITDEVREVS